MVRACFALVFVLLLSSAAAAAVLGIGSSQVSPDVWNYATIQPGITAVADTGVQPYSFDGGLTTGQYEEFVLTDANNTFCAGCLDFALLVSVDPSSTYSLDVVRFGQWNSQTDVGYVTGAPGAGTVAPTAVFRGTGNNVGFDFFTYVGGTPTDLTLVPGSETQILLVETDATNYWAHGRIFFNDSNGPLNFGTSGGSFGPVFVPTPEPSTLSMAGIVLLGLAIGYRRRTSRAPLP